MNKNKDIVCLMMFISGTRVNTLTQVVPATFLLVYFVCLKESTRETKKNVFYFTSKALFVLEIIIF